MPKTKKINIIHFILSLEIGGMERFVAEHSLGLDREKYNIEVCCCDALGPFSKVLTEQGINVTLLKKRQDRYDFFYPLQVSNFLKAKQTDILHMHSGSFFIGTQAGLLARTPSMVYTDHGRHLIEPKKLIWMDRFCGLFVDKIVAVSKELEDYLIKVIKLPKKKTCTIINGTNFTEFKSRPKPESLLNEFQLDSKTKIIGTVGRLAQVKDQASLIKAFALINQKSENSKLILVGDGPLMVDLRGLAKELNIEDKIIFTGNRKDISRLLNLMDVFTLTSLSEGTSISLLEAMASGVPPVVTNVGGNPSLVKTGENGILVEPGEIEKISEAILDIVTNKKNATSLGAAARTSIESYSSIEMIRQYQNIYDNILYK